MSRYREREIRLPDIAEQIRPKFFAIPLLEDFQIKGRGPGKKKHVLKVVIDAALELAKGDVVRSITKRWRLVKRPS
jgi:hypothetical protein